MSASRAKRSTQRRVLRYLGDGEWRTFDEILHGAGGSRWRVWLCLTEAAGKDIVEMRDESGYKTGHRNRRLYRIAPKYLDTTRMNM